MKNVTRRGFLAGSALTAGLVGLAGCNAGGAASEPLAAPAADKYPIEPDKDDVKAKWASEEVRDGWTKVTTGTAAASGGVMDAAKIIQVDGYAFNDLNGDGKLDLYEDQPSPSTARQGPRPDDERRRPVPAPVGGRHQSSSTTTDTSAMDYIEAGSRAGVSRLQSSIKSYATDVEWINKVQETCEKSTYGIPYLNYSDPYVLFGVPSSIGLSTIMDKDVWQGRHVAGPRVACHGRPLRSRSPGRRLLQPHRHPYLRLRV